MPITYVCFVWSLGDDTTTFDIHVEDKHSNILQTFPLGPSSVANDLNVSEFYPSPPISTVNTRLLRLLINVLPTNVRVTLYSIMIGYN